MTKILLAQIAVDNQEQYNRWRVEARVDGSNRKVMARCLDCDNVYIVDLFSLRRKDKKSPVRCQTCNNKILSAGNRQDPGTALRKGEYNAYRKNARARRYEWKIPFSLFANLIEKPCWYCGDLPSRVVESSWDTILVNGLDRRDNSVGYTEENTVTCCKDCNYAKRTMSEEKFILLCNRVAERNRR